MFALGIEQQIMVECLIAFAHSRITGVAGKGQDGILIFNKKEIQQDAVESGEEMANILKELSTIETINHKIANSKGHISCMYFNYYSKLTFLMDKHIGADEGFIEGLVGFHLLRLATEKGLIGNGVDNLDYYNYVIGNYENENYTKDGEVAQTVKNMRVVSNLVFEDFLRKKKKVVNKKRKAS